MTAEKTKAVIAVVVALLIIFNAVHLAGVFGPSEATIRLAGDRAVDDCSRT